MKKPLFLVVFATLFYSGCAFRLTKATDDRKSERLATEEGRLSVATDPVARLRSYLIVSETLLDFASESVRDGHGEHLLPFLKQYTNALEGARETLVTADTNPRRFLPVYKDLEIALRKQMQLLGDIAAGLTIDERPPVDTALQTAKALREDLLRRLFPSG